MKCSKCGFENPDSADYCQECGEYLHEERNINMKETQTVVKTVKVTDKKMLAKWVFSAVLFTGVLIGGYSLFQVHQIQQKDNIKIKELQDENKELEEKIEKMNNAMDKTSVDYEKEIVELEKENNELKKQIDELQKEIDQQSTDSKDKDSKEENTDKETSTDNQ